MLLGFRDDCFEVGEWRKATFFISSLILQRSNNMKWCFMLVYGPADHNRTNEFLEVLERSVAACPVPIVVGGDFNLIRSAGDKSNGNIYWSRVRRFNDTIASLSLREIRRAGARFMWTNKQLDPISGEGLQSRPSRFLFQTWWLQVNGFGELFKGKLASFLTDFGPHRGSIEVWQYVARHSRQFLKGWGANLGKEKRVHRENLLSQVENIDREVDAAGLDEEGWALRYHLEDQLLQLDKLDEEYWRQHSRLNWTLKGDSNTTFFHEITNGLAPPL
ncbi:uncharacterized protein [Lolium perenne]|uniref:uncharacterized protein n=1 Tax=Lolium perenne TaxID=4522 RepID=UPI003A991144